MKKTLKISGIVLAVILLLMIIIPLFFKSQLAEIVKKEANKNLNATLNFQDVGLNLFSSFPNLALSINELTIINKAPFEGDTLIRLGSFKASVDLWSVLFGDKIRITSISLKEPDIFVYVLKDSTANYNIMKETAPAEKDTAKSEMNISLKSYEIVDANIAFIDQTSDMVVAIKNLNHSGSGDFSKDIFTLETETTIDSLTFESGNIPFLNKVNVKLDMNVEADMVNKKFTLKDNSLQLNNLLLKFSGTAQMKDSSIITDIKFGTVRTDFKDFISLIPAVYTKDFNDLQSSGKLGLDGYVKGVYEKEKLPSFNVNVKVDNGNFRYPKLPTPVNNVNMDLGISNPGGSKDKTEINLSKLHLEIGKEPFDARLLLKTPLSNPYVDAAMKGRINLGQIKNSVNIEGVTKLEGLISADFQAKGNIGNAEKKQLENLNASGNISVTNLVYASNTLPQDVKISQGSLTLSPKNFTLTKIYITTGKSDISASGSLSNALSYVLNDGTISGNLNLSSNYLDVNPFIQKGGSAETKKAETKKEAVELPERINFVMNSSFNKVIFDNLTLENIKGVISLKDQRLNLNNLSMNLLGGSLTAIGYYNAPDASSQSVSFDFAINNFDIGKTYESFVTVRQFAPMAKYIHGNFDAKIKMATPLDIEMMPVWNQFNSTGSLNLERAEIKDFKPFEEAGNLLKINELIHPVLSNVKPSFRIVNGRMYISPFSYKVMNYNLTFSGSNGLDKTIDYTMNVEIPAEKLSNQANSALNKIFKKDVNLVTSKTINVKTYMRGNIESPQVTASGGDVVTETTKNIEQEVKQQVQQQVEEKKEQAKKEIQKQVDTLQNTLKKKAEEQLQGLFKRKK